MRVRKTHYAVSLISNSNHWVMSNLKKGCSSCADSTPKTNLEDAIEIESLQLAACKSTLKFYIDPKSGYKVMTEWCHLERGSCCGSKCRHCPYGYINVK